MEYTIEIRFHSPIKKLTEQQEKERIDRLGGCTDLFSPYDGVIIAVNGEEIPQPIAIRAIKTNVLSSQVVSGLSSDLWNNASKLDDLRSGKKYKVSKVVYRQKRKKLNFLMKEETTGEVIACKLRINLHLKQS